MNDTTKLEQITESVLLKEFGDMNIGTEDPNELKNAIDGLRLASAALAKIGMKKLSDSLNRLIAQLTSSKLDQSPEQQGPGAVN